MSRRTTRGNRVGLAVTGLVLTLAGAAALARGLAIAPHLLGAAHQPLTDARTRHYATHHAWFWPALAATAVVIALLAVYWLLTQTRSEAITTLRLEPDPGRGTTTLPARAVTDALTSDLTDNPTLKRAHATLTGTPAMPRLVLTVTLDPARHPAAAQERIQEATTRLRDALETDHLPTTIRLHAR